MNGDNPQMVRFPHLPIGTGHVDVDKFNITGLLLFHEWLSDDHLEPVVDPF